MTDERTPKPKLALDLGLMSITHGTEQGLIKNMPILMFLHGTTISGILVTRAEYYKGLDDTLAAHGVDRFFEATTNPAETAIAEPPESFLYLRDVRVLSANGQLITIDNPQAPATWIRVRTSSIDGWTIGSFA